MTFVVKRYSKSLKHIPMKKYNTFENIGYITTLYILLGIGTFAFLCVYKALLWAFGVL